MKSKLINKNWYSWEETVRMNNPSIVSPGGGKESMPTVGRICEKGRVILFFVHISAAFYSGLQKSTLGSYVQ